MTAEDSGSAKIYYTSTYMSNPATNYWAVIPTRTYASSTAGAASSPIDCKAQWEWSSDGYSRTLLTLDENDNGPYYKWSDNTDDTSKEYRWNYYDASTNGEATNK